MKNCLMAVILAGVAGTVLALGINAWGHNDFLKQENKKKKAADTDKASEDRAGETGECDEPEKEEISETKDGTGCPKE